MAVTRQEVVILMNDIKLIIPRVQGMIDEIHGGGHEKAACVCAQFVKAAMAAHHHLIEVVGTVAHNELNPGDPV
jgi:hypothetical protein